LSDREGVQQSGRHGLVRTAVSHAGQRQSPDDSLSPDAALKVKHFSLGRLG
jgi:hypothetical protein